MGCRNENGRTFGTLARKIAAAWGSAALRARSPVGHDCSGGRFFNFGQTGAMPIGSHGPLRSGAIRELVHQPLVIVSQFQRLTGIGKAPLKWTDHVGDAEL